MARASPSTRRPEAGRARARSAGPARAARRARQGRGEVQGEGGRGRDHQRQHRRDHRARVAPRLRSQQSGRRARQGSHQPHDCRRVRDGLHLQGAHHRDGDRSAESSTSTRSLDARKRLRYGTFTINDFHGKNRVLTVPEIFIYSSNIGTARMALAVGVEGHKAFLRKMGQLDRLRDRAARKRRAARAPEMGRAQHHHDLLRPRSRRRAAAGGRWRWRALINGGVFVTPTFLKRNEEEAKAGAPQVMQARRRARRCAT